jgi:hypothetical protein
VLSFAFHKGGPTLKKQKNAKKLELNKETLTAVESVSGGSVLWNTVYYPQRKDPFTTPIVIA